MTPRASSLVEAVSERDYSANVDLSLFANDSNHRGF